MKKQDTDRRKYTAEFKAEAVALTAGKHADLLLLIAAGKVVPGTVGPASFPSTATQQSGPGSSRKANPGPESRNAVSKNTSRRLPERHAPNPEPPGAKPHPGPPGRPSRIANSPSENPGKRTAKPDSLSIFRGVA